MNLDNLAFLIPEKWWAVLIKESNKYQDSRNDSGHTLEVVKTASRIMNEKQSACLTFNKNTVLAAALFHDIGWSQIDSQERFSLFNKNLIDEEEKVLRIKHEKLGADLAKKIMKKAGFANDFIDEVCRLIDGHDTRSSPLSDNDAILRDSDRLWMLSLKGFRADIERRNLNPAQWYGILKKAFFSF